MIKHLTSHGNSSALVIEKPILELLNINHETPLKITTDGDVLTITPVRDDTSRKMFKAAYEKARKRHAKTLKKLAE